MFGNNVPTSIVQLSSMIVNGNGNPLGGPNSLWHFDPAENPTPFAVPSTSSKPSADQIESWQECSGSRCDSRGRESRKSALKCNQPGHIFKSPPGQWSSRAAANRRRMRPSLPRAGNGRWKGSQTALFTVALSPPPRHASGGSELHQQRQSLANSVLYAGATSTDS